MNLTKYRHIVFILAAGGLLTLVMILLVAQPGRAAGPWYVAPGGDDGNDCLNPATPCATINGGIGKASPGDTIYVAIGTYTGTGDEVVLLDRDATLSGGWDASFTTQSGTSTIDGEGSHGGIHVNGGVIATVERFIVQNGSKYTSSGWLSGIDNGGTLTLNNCIVRNNSAASYSGGGIDNGGTLTLNHSTVSGNTAGWYGGGIYNDGTVTLNSSAVTGNTTGSVSGIHYGGIYNDGGTMTLTSSIVSGNTGRGISNDNGNLTLTNSTVSGNTGRGVSNSSGTTNESGTMTLANSTVSGNANSGIFNSGTLTLTNSTVSGNVAGGGGGGIRNEGTLRLTNSTVGANMATGDGGGIANNGGTVTMQNSILAGNLAGGPPDCSGTIGSSGYNLVGNTSGCTFTPGTGDLTNVNPKLGQLIGTPGYHPLLSGSPAIDAVPLGQCTLATDQRGAARPQGPACDIGAYEYTTPGPAASLLAFGGTPQRTPPLSPFAAPFQALVLDSIGSPVHAATVTFSAPATGASGNFTDSGATTTTALTNESGVATAATLTANGLEGGYTVTATVGGVMTPANFLLTNFGWYASPTGSDVNDCQTPATPCATIDGPLEKPGFAAGDTVLVATGTYTGTNGDVVLLDQDVRLSGGWDPAFAVQDGVSIVDGEGARRCVWVNSGVTAIMERFTMQNGSADSNGGGGIFNQGTLTLKRCTVSGNTGSGIRTGFYSRASLTLNHCTVSGNIAGSQGGSGTGGGGGIDNAGNLTVNNSAVTGNEVLGGFQGGGIRNSGMAILNNSTVGGNTVDTGGGIFNSGTLIVSSSTLSGNSAWWGGGIYNEDFYDGTVIVQNTILAGNTASDAGPDCSGTIGSSGYNLLGDTTDCTFSTATGDILDVDAGLVPLADLLGYFPLYPDSLTIDAVPLAQCTLATDQRGVARPQGPACDIGAYEYTIPGPAASIDAFGGTPQRTAPFTTFEMPFEALVLDGTGSPVQDALVTFSAPASGAGGTFADSGTSTTTDTTDGGGVATAAPFTANELEGSYTVTATVSGVATPAPFLLSNIAWYVAPGGDDANDCLTAATPCATVNGALGKPGFVGGDTVVVAIGTYTGTGDEVVLIDKDATLSGGWDEAFTTQEGMSTIDGQQVRRGIRVDTDVSAVVERFAVQNGSGGIRNGGILALNNCTVSGNMDGGIYNADLVFPCYPSLTLNNSTVRGNTADEGAGIYNEGILALNNSTVSGNSAQYRGGGIYNSGVVYPARILILNNSTVSRNTAQEGGGIFAAGAVTLTNTILAGNSASGGPDCTWGRVDSFGYNLVGDTSDCTFAATTGDLIDVNPRLFTLVGLPGYHPLRPGSPAIDAGNPDGCTDHLSNPLDTDQRGIPRPLDGDGDGNAVCDMGAYEVDPEHPIRQLFLPIIPRNY